jgi:hypothetical protein
MKVLKFSEFYLDAAKFLQAAQNGSLKPRVSLSFFENSFVQLDRAFAVNRNQIFANFYKATIGAWTYLLESALESESTSLAEISDVLAHLEILKALAKQEKSSLWLSEMEGLRALFLEKQFQRIQKGLSTVQYQDALAKVRRSLYVAKNLHEKFKPNSARLTEIKESIAVLEMKTAQGAKGFKGVAQ